ncbi:MAG: DUF4349 domain-containing protein [Candidatus Woesearchaeota archaeon]
MTIKDQFSKIKENWLLVLILVLVVGFLGVGNTISSVFTSASQGIYAKSSGGYAQETMMADSAMMRAPGYYEQDFAPEVEDRKLTKTTSLTTEVKRGSFYDAENKVKAIIQSTDSFLLNENVNKYGTSNSYLEGSYQIKVESKKYSAVVTQLKELGEVQYFSENTQDITARYTDLSTELAAEKARLERFKEMLAKAEDVNEQIELTDRIFNIERTISYYESSLKNVDNKVDYSTVYLTLKEKESSYAGIALTKFSRLIRNLVESFNGLIGLIFWALPWVVVALLVWFGVGFFKKKNKKK